MKNELQTLTNDLFNIIREAGAIVISDLNKEIFFSEKGETNFVTRLDYEVQDFLIEALSKLLPSSIIISEESNSIGNINSNKFVWIIDPIDGTTNVIHNYPFYSLSIALFVEGEISIGIIYNPTNKELFHAIKGQGAFLNNVQIRVSNTPILKNALVGFGFPYDKNKTKRIVELIGVIVSLTHDLRRTGSAALDLAYIACGRLDGYFEFDLEIWDYAAGILLISESGGLVSDWQNRTSNFSKRINIVATNNKIHKELTEHLGEITLPSNV